MAPRLPYREDLDASLLANYYDELARGKPVKVVDCTGQGRGFGLFANRGFSVGEEVFVEKAVVGMQQAENRVHVLACNHCYRFVGSLRLQAGLLVGRCTRTSIGTGAKVDKGWEYPFRELPPEKMNASLFAGQPVVSCSQGSGEVYCSEACRDDNMRSSLWLLCTGPIDSMDHPLIQFKTFACQTNDIFLLVAKALAEAMARYKSNGGDLLGAVLPLLCFHARLWWDVVAPGDSDPSLRQQCKDLVAEAADLLRQTVKALGHWQEPFEAIVSEDLISRLIGAFEMNNIGMVIKSPLQIYLDTARRIGGKAAEEADAYIDAVREGMSDDEDADAEGEAPGDDSYESPIASAVDDDEECSMPANLSTQDQIVHGNEEEQEHGATKRPRLNGLEVIKENTSADGGADEVKDFNGAESDGGVSDHSDDKDIGEDTEEDEEEEEEDKLGFFDGTGLYSLACMMNHSCEPNIRVLYPQDGQGAGEAHIVVHRPIKEGDELTISYIEETMPVHKRQEELQTAYGFKCVCPKCQREQAEAQT